MKTTCSALIVGLAILRLPACGVQEAIWHCESSVGLLQELKVMNCT